MCGGISPFDYFDYHTSLERMRGALAGKKYAVALDVDEADKKVARESLPRGGGRRARLHFSGMRVIRPSPGILFPVKLLFSGDPGCSTQTLKRLMIVSEELAFMDRPSVMVGGWGMIGINSPLRQFEQAMQDTVPSLKVYVPPVGPISALHEEYVRRDLINSSFREVFLRGLKTSDDFAFKFLQLEADYGPPAGTGEAIRQAILDDATLADAEISTPYLEGRPFQTNTEVGRRDTLRMLLTEASVRITGTLAVASETGMMPVTDDPIFAELLALRFSGKDYVGDTSTLAPWLGLEIATAVIPDEALTKLNYADIFEYPKTAKDAYDSWFITINKWASEIDAMTPVEVSKQLLKLRAEKLLPSVIEYQNEMKTIAEKLWGISSRRLRAIPYPYYRSETSSI